MKPSLGKTLIDDTTIYIDVEALLESRMLLQASSGGGKSYALRRILEQTAGHAQQFVFDPEGEFASLREKHDFVIAAAHDGDALAHPKTAKVLARRLLETGVSAVLDIYDLKKHDRMAFVRLFLEAMMEAPKSLWHPVLVVLDEAHLFCPEKEPAESKEAVIDLATRGRKRGYALLAATQRIAKFSKDAAAELTNKVIGRAGLDIDVKRAADELGMNYKDAMFVLRRLEAGQFHVFGPALSVEPVLIQIGPVSTTHPKLGDRLLRAPPKPTAAILKILPTLADLPKEAEAQVKTLEDLRRENAELRKESAELKRAVATKGLTHAEQDALYRTAFAEGSQAGIKDARKEYERSINQERKELKKAVLHKLGELFDNAAVLELDRLDTSIESKYIHKTVALPTPKPGNGARPVAAPPPKPKVWPTDESTVSRETFSSAQLAIIDALYWLGVVQNDQMPTRDKLSTIAGKRGGNYKNLLGALRSAGLIEYPPNAPGTVTLTARGADLALMPSDDRPFLDQCRERLSASEQSIFDVLRETPGHTLTRDELSEVSGKRGGNYKNLLGHLRTMGVIDYPEPGKVALRDWVLL